jgi:16S rRNA C967 or C1407 C5-methylase (RsmB/RsmF family)/NOL1/NOP2/fmu family ribosome biogenesis protein
VPTEIPKQLLNSLTGLEGFNEKAFVEAHAEEHKITSIRFNPFKKTLPDFELGDKVLWANDAWYLAARPSFTLDPLFHAGCYYVQEAGSMFIEFALKNTVDLTQELKVLDLCGAPGGKSTLINSLLNDESLLVANELIKSRAGILAHNLAKWGTHNTVVTNNEAAKFGALTGFFDILVIDAPCSGSGLFRKQPEAIAEWSEDNVNLCSTRQRNILEETLPCLKENGILLYSTCSYSEKENEAIVKFLIEAHGFEYLPLPVPPEWGIVDTGFGYRFYPHLLKSEGFFCAALRKKKAEDPVYILKKKSGLAAIPAPTASEITVLQPFLGEQPGLLIKKNEQFHELNQAAFNFLAAFEKNFYFKKAGCVLGEIKGNDMIPNQELAWSISPGKNLRVLALDLDNALNFLRKESISADGAARGLVLVTYGGFGLGWAKILPNRVNNYFPGELRILSRKP